MNKHWKRSLGSFIWMMAMPFMPKYVDDNEGGGDAPPALPEGFDIAALSGDAWAGIVQGDERFKENPVALNTKDPLDAIDQLINANKLMGQDRLPQPQDDWDEAKYDSFYNSLGRPENAEGYKYENAPEIEGFEVSEEFTKSANEAMHKAGLNVKQHTAVMDTFYEWLGKATTAGTEADALVKQQAEETLKSKYGSEYDGKVAQANAVIAELGTPELADYLEKSGAGNDPRMVEFMLNVAEKFGDDQALGEALNSHLSGTNQAVKKIADLKADDGFIKRLNNEDATGHAEAVAEWIQLHKKAYPGTQNK
jgi:hypothetical protein